MVFLPIGSPGQHVFGTGEIGRSVGPQRSRHGKHRILSGEVELFKDGYEANNALKLGRQANLFVRSEPEPR